MYAHLILGCAAPLVPGEVVLGVEHAAAFTYGGPGDHLGASVAGRGDRWLASAPGAGQTWRDGIPGDGPSLWVGWWGEGEVLVSSGGHVSVGGDERISVPDALAWAAGPAGIVAATPSGLLFVEGEWGAGEGMDDDRLVPVEGLQAVALGVDRVLGLVCAPEGEECVGSAWSFAGALLGTYARGGDGGAVGEWEGRAWAGAPDWATPEGTGEVCAEDGACRVGLPGDHLGAALGGGYAAGTFNKWIVPPRARVVPLGEGDVYTIETGAELQPITLAGDDVLVIGLPYAAAHGVPSGAVVRVSE